MIVMRIGSATGFTPSNPAYGKDTEMDLSMRQLCQPMVVLAMTSHKYGSFESIRVSPLVAALYEARPIARGRIYFHLVYGNKKLDNQLYMLGKLPT